MGEFMNRKRREIISTNKVSRVVSYSLGGYNQKVLLDGKYEKNPVMLFLHGGPGIPAPFSVGCRGMYPEFTDHFIMVYWDQLGCGINNHPIDDNFSIDTFVDMTIDLVKALKKEFPDNQLILFGASWGSVLSAKVAVKLPGLIDNVLVCGQVLNNLFFNAEVYETLSKVDLSQKAKKQLMEIQDKKEKTIEDIKRIAMLIRKYTEGYQVKSKDKMKMSGLIYGLLTSPDYSLKDFIAVIKNGFMKNKSILNELLRIDLSDILRNVQVPYHILQGSLDIVTSTKAVSAFVQNSKNDYLSLRVLANNGHMPSTTGMNEVLKESINLIKIDT